jgi:pyridoxine/pyridoxamine 5'-phosphate oxidase
VTTLTSDFYAREDSTQRGAIWSQRTKVLDDMERLKKDMAEQEKAIAKIEADARRANIPPGWIR